MPISNPTTRDVGVPIRQGSSWYTLVQKAHEPLTVQYRNRMLKRCPCKIQEHLKTEHLKSLQTQSKVTNIIVAVILTLLIGT